MDIPKIQSRKYRPAGRMTILCLRIWISCLFIGVFFFAQHLEVLAQEPQNTEAYAAFESPAPVIVNGKVLFELSGASSYPAKERARAVAGRIRQAAADSSVDAGSLNVVPEGDIFWINAGKKQILGLTATDAAKEGISLDILTTLVLERIKETIIEYRHDRTPRVLLVNSGYAIAATLLVALLIWGIVRLFAWFEGLIQRRTKTHIQRLESKSHYIIRAEMLLDFFAGIVRTVRIVVVLVVAYFYLNLVLGLYPWTRMFAKQLFTLTLNPLLVMGRGLITALPNLFFLVILYIFIRYVLKMAHMFFAGIDRGRIRIVNFDREWALPTYKIVRLIIISFALVVAYPYIPGSGSDAFKGISIFLGVIFSLGSSSVLSHIIAGYTLTYRRAYKIGDRVNINDMVGDIEDRTLLVTRMRSLKNEEIVIPNSLILNRHVINYSTLAQNQGLILHTTVGIGYEVPWRQVESMLLLAAARTPGIKKEPQPFVLQRSLGDFAINYELNVYSDDASQMMPQYSALHRNILDVFNEYGVQIMTPNYERDTDQPKIVPKDHWYAPPAGKPEPAEKE